MSLIALLLTFTVLMVIGAPVAMVMFGSSLVYILMEPTINLSSMITKIIGGISSQSLLALPLYILAAEVMNSAGITRRLFNLPLAFIGHIKGGLAHVNIVSSVLFAGMSGNAIADTAGLGKIEMQFMKEEGYDVPFSAAITAASSTIGPIIPPSATMIIWATAAEVSVAKLFIGGLLPGIIMAVTMMLYVSLIASRKYAMPTRPKASWKERKIALKESLLPMLTPIIIILGIVTGICTATEAGAIACVYAIGLNYYYTRFTFKEFLVTIKTAFSMVAKICFIVAASALFGWVITMAQIPALISEFLISIGASKWTVLILINVVLLFMGCFLSITSSILIAAPTLVVLAQMYGIDLVQLGVIVTLNLTIGLLTPPVGWNLYIMSEISGISFGEMVKATIPLLVSLFISLLIITYIPQAVLWLPNLLLG